MAIQDQYGQQDESSMQIEVKKVTDNIVICNLHAAGMTSEFLLKRGDYDALVERGFFRLNSIYQQDSGAVASTDVYTVNNPHLVG